MMTTDQQLLDRVSALLGRRDLFLTQQQNWFAGSATGGPNGDGRFPLTDSNGYERMVPSPAAIELAGNKALGLSIRTPQQHMGAAPSISDAVKGADGKWSGSDALPAIQSAIDWCYARGGGTVFIPKMPGAYLLSSPGTPMSDEPRVRGLIRLRPHVKIISDGATVVVSGGRFNPPSMFAMDYAQNANVDNVRVSGLTLDMNMANQSWTVGTSTGGDDVSEFQFQAGIEFFGGDNVEIDHCVFRNTRGSAISAGNVFVDYLDHWTTRNLHIHHCEFYNCYREAAFIPWICGGSFDHNYVHGDGYLVAAVDLERHTANERLNAFSVHNNTFDFRDGHGPIERGKAVRTRRAVSMGFFYDGYRNNVDDGLFGKINITDNFIWQGQIDHWGASDVIIRGNTFAIDKEDLTYVANGATKKVSFVSGHAINAQNQNFTTGLQGPVVADNIITTKMNAPAIECFSYRNCMVTGNRIVGCDAAGIKANYIGGNIANNVLEDVGSQSNQTAAIVALGNYDVLNISNNIAIETRPYNHTQYGDIRGMTYAVETSGVLDAPCTVMNNTGRNLRVPSESYKPHPSGGVTAFGNTNGDTAVRLHGYLTIGTGVGTSLVKVDGALNEDRALQFMSDGQLDTSIGVFGRKLSMFYMNDNGGFGGNFMTGDKDTGDVVMNSGKLVIDGTWQKPLTFGYIRMWVDLATGRFYKSFGDPTGPTDGQPIEGSLV